MIKSDSKDFYNVTKISIYNKNKNKKRILEEKCHNIFQKNYKNN